jgi:hypothetical protein
MNAQRGSITIELLSLNLVAGWRWVVTGTLQPLYLREGTPVSTGGAGWAPEPKWTCWEVVTR